MRQRIDLARRTSRKIEKHESRQELCSAAESAGRAAALPLERLEQVCRVFSYMARWTEQIQERLVQLSF